MAELLRVAGTPGPDCLDESLLTRLAGGEIDAVQLDAAREHARSCSRCACDLEIAQAFAADTKLTPVQEETVADVVAVLRRPGAATPEPSRRRGIWHLHNLLPVTAALLTVVAVALFLQMRPDAPPPVPEAGTTVARSGGVRQLAPRGTVQVVPPRLVWEPYEQAPTFRVRLLAVDDAILWETVTAGDSIDLPTAVLEGLAARVTYRWSIEPIIDPAKAF